MTYATLTPAQVTKSTVRDYISLLKPRVMSLVVFTGGCGLLLAPGHIHPFLAFITILCIALGSGASGAINMWYDRDIDLLMKRTANRPIPAGRVNPDEALGFGVAMAIASVLILGIATNPTAAMALAAAILFYVFIYTIWLKRRTPQNIVIGGAAGAFPPIIGWAAVTGDITAMPIILFTIIFLWTPPHFWALSLLIKDEYKNAKVPMLPVVSGEKITRINVFVYTLILAAFTFAPVIAGYSGALYFAAAILLNAVFIYYSTRLLRYKTNTEARKTFKYSISYLFLLYLMLVLDKFINLPIHF